METARQVINDALQEIVVQASEQPIQTVDFQTARRYLNRMMSTVPFVGLGYTVVTNPSDLVTVPDAALEGIIFNLAKRLLSSYDMPLTTELMLSAKNGLKEIRRLTVSVGASSHPCTLPIGAGNESNGSYSDQHFYSCSDSEIATEQGGTILLENNND